MQQFSQFLGAISNFLQNIIPESIWMEFNDFQYSRIEIWHKGFEIVFNNPIFGTGAGSFPEIFKLETGLWKGHAQSSFRIDNKLWNTCRNTYTNSNFFNNI